MLVERQLCVELDSLELELCFLHNWYYIEGDGRELPTWPMVIDGEGLGFGGLK